LVFLFFSSAVSTAVIVVVVMVGSFSLPSRGIAGAVKDLVLTDVWLAVEGNFVILSVLF
jgi:hypothetical protein